MSAPCAHTNFDLTNPVALKAEGVAQLAVNNVNIVVVAMVGVKFNQRSHSQTPLIAR